MSSEKEIKVAICRVYHPPLTKEGVWILIDRLWPRGLKKEALAFDFWLKELAPSTLLRKWFHEAPLERWHEFYQAYLKELQEKKPLLEEVQKMARDKGVTLFYAAKDCSHNQAIILQKVLYNWPHLTELP